MANPGQTKEEEKKVKRPTQQKRQIQNEKCRLINKSAKTRIKSVLKNCMDLVESKDLDKANISLSQFSSLVDKAAKKGIFKQNKADRMKSRLASKLA